MRASSVIDALDALTTPILVSLGLAALKATAVLLAAALAARALRRASAASRHLVWTTALAAALSLWVLPALLPVWRILPAPPAGLSVMTRGGDVTATRSSVISTGTSKDVSARPSSDAATPRAGATRPPASAVDSETAAGASSAASPSITVFAIRWPALILAVWLVGCLFVGARYVWSHAQLRRLTRRREAAGNTAATIEMQAIAVQWHIARPVALIECDAVDMPLTWGILQPRVVLPGDASTWTAERRRHVLEHELAHVKRLDAGTQLLAQLTSAAFWFHPLVWHAARRMRHERERACDDYVLTHGAVASSYAGDLLELAEACAASRCPAAGLAMAQRSQFEGRLRAILDPAQDRRALSISRIFTGVGLAAALTVPLAAMRTVAAVSPGHSATVPVKPTAPGTSLAPPALPATQATRAQHDRDSSSAGTTLALQRTTSAVPATNAAGMFDNCGRTGSEHSSNNQDNDGAGRKWSASWRSGACTFDLISEGTIAFSDDFSSVTRISAGGFIDIATSVPGRAMHMIARPSDAGVTYEFSLNGSPRSFQGEGPAWLADALVSLDRRTAFAIDARFPKLIQQGPPAVLAEAERMTTARSRGLYLLRLLQSVQLDKASMLKALQLAGAPAENSEVTRVLIAAAGQFRLTDPDLAHAYLTVAVELRGDSERARALMALMDAGPLAARDVPVLLGSIGAMHSDSDKTRLLVRLARLQPLEGAARAAYVEAAGGVHSERERSRALTALRER